MVQRLGFDFLELSIDESDERLARLAWGAAEREQLRQALKETQVPIHSLCLSAHRRYPFGSADHETQEKARWIMQQAIDFAYEFHIPTIQLAGYDVYYETKGVATRERYIRQLKEAVCWAADKGIVLAIEIMDDPFLSSIQDYLILKKQIPSAFLKVYPDLGNLSAWPENDVGAELEAGIGEIQQIHLKDTLAVHENFSGQFRNVLFGQGCVDFAGCLQTLKRLNFAGSFVVEMWHQPTEDAEKNIEAAKAFLWPILAQAGYQRGGA